MGFHLMLLRDVKGFLIPKICLFSGTRYKFRVSAENRHGGSPESQAVTTRMLEEGNNDEIKFQIPKANEFIASP